MHMRIITIIAALLFGLISYGQEHTLEMKIHNFPGNDCYLATFYGDKNDIIDTAVADTNGRIIFNLKTHYHTGMYRVFLDKNIFF